MYPVSAAYTAAIADPQRITCVTGSITLADGTRLPITDESIVLGSLYLSSQCVSGDDIDIGSVYASELGFVLKTDMENPYSLQGARVALQFGVQVADGSVERVPLGYYYADTPTRQAGKIALKCYDGLLLFDRPMDAALAPDTAYALLSAACAAAGVTLAMSQTDIEALPNGTLTLTPPSGNSAIKTWRDLLMWVCQALSGWAAMDRMGQLEIRGYGSISRRDISPGVRMRTTAADTQVQVTQVTMKLGEATHSQGAEGMTMALDANPLFGALNDAMVDTALAAILGQMGAAQYVPATVEFNGDPALDPGDLVTLPATPAGDLTIPVMKSTWRYRGRHTIAAVGKSTRLRSEYSQNSKAVSAIATAAQAANQLAQAANQSAQLINDAIGGHVLIRQSARPDETNEILIMDSADPAQAVKIWRWNLGGLGYSAGLDADGNLTQGADNPARQYAVAITMDGVINAQFVKGGRIEGDVIFAGELSAATGSFDHLLAGKLDDNGNPVGAYLKMGIDGFGDPYIDIFDDDRVRQRSIRKDGDTYGGNIVQSTYSILNRVGVGTFVR